MDNRSKGPFLSRHFLILLAVGVMLLFLPLFSGDYLKHVMILIFFFAYLGQSWNILGGYAGQLSIGHSAYFGMGAYTSTLLFVSYGLSPWIGMFLGGSAAAALGLFVGYLCFRFGLKGPYFALATLAFAEILRLVALNMSSIGGAQGLLIPLIGNSPLKYQFLDKKFYYYIAFGMMLISILIVWKIDKMKIGYCLKALHQNEDAAEALGIDVTLYKLAAVALSAFLTALGGTFYAQYMMYIEPDFCFGSYTSIEIIIRPIIGGVGTVFGPVLGAFILTPLSEIMRNIIGVKKAGIHVMVFGAILMFVCVYMQRGILPWLKGKLRG